MHTVSKAQETLGVGGEEVVEDCKSWRMGRRGVKWYFLWLRRAVCTHELTVVEFTYMRPTEVWAHQHSILDGERTQREVLSLRRHRQLMVTGGRVSSIS